MGGCLNDGNRCKPKGSLFTEGVVGFTQVYYEDRNVERRQNDVEKIRPYTHRVMAISQVSQL